MKPEHEKVSEGGRATHEMSIWRTSEMIMLSALLVAIALEYFFPLPPLATNSALVPVMSVFLFGLGVWLIWSAQKELRKHNQSNNPEHVSSTLVATGVFNQTRNPIYLGNLLMLFACALSLLNWMLVLFLPIWVVYTCFLVLPEERALLMAHGADYIKYTKKTSRWFSVKHKF